jgi:hypothetical protein
MVDDKQPDSGPSDRSADNPADRIAKDDPHKTEKLTKAGRSDLDPDERDE